MRPLRVGPRSAGLALICLVAAACSTPTTLGSASVSPTNIRDLTAEQILATAKATAQAQTSVHLRGDGGCPQGAFFADMTLRKDDYGSGTVRFGDTTIELIATPEMLYVRAPKTYWQQVSPAAADVIGSHWVSVPKSGNPCLTALGSFSNVLANYLDYPGTPTKEAGDTVFTVPAQLVSLPPDVAIWVRAIDAPLPVQVSQPSTGTKIALGDWGAEVTVTAPPPADVISSSTLSTASPSPRSS